MTENSIFIIWSLHLFTTLVMVGIIWFVQIVHYPLFAWVGEKKFVDYEKQHVAKTGFVVVPPMMIEIITGALLLYQRPDNVSVNTLIVTLVLLMVVWLSTFLLQVPTHQKLEKNFDIATYKFLLNTNWIRTCGWTLRGIILITMI